MSAPLSVRWAIDAEPDDEAKLAPAKSAGDIALSHASTDSYNALLNLFPDENKLTRIKVHGHTSIGRFKPNPDGTHTFKGHVECGPHDEHGNHVVSAAIRSTEPTGSTK